MVDSDHARGDRVQVGQEPRDLLAGPPHECLMAPFTEAGGDASHVLAVDFGGAVRHYETAEVVRIAAPIYLKYGLRNAPPLYPSGGHLEATVVALSRERVRRAAIGLALLERK